MLLSFDNKKAAIALYRLMIRILKYFLWATLAVIVIACTDDDSFTASPNNRLTFSTDTVRMDTVFSSVPTSTRTFWVYNRSGDGIRCLSVGLERGNQSGFRVNVDGSYLGSSSGYQVSDIEVRDKDSIRVFVELTSPLNHGNTPQKIEDNLVFRLESGIEQKVNLNAWSWDADMMRDVVVESDMTIGGDVPVIIYGGIVVREGATLTLNDGVTLYFHDGAGIDVYGRLVVNGTAEKNVVLRGDRLDRMFDYLPYDHVSGQWKGIRFHEKSYENIIDYADIHAACDAIVCDSSDVNRMKLLLSNSIVHNSKGYGVEAVHSNVDIRNCQITNSLNDCLAVYGGKVSVWHCTLAQFYPFDAARGMALRFTNYRDEHVYPLQDFTCVNTIVTGYADDVLSGASKDEATAFSWQFSHCLLRTPQPETDLEKMVEVVFEDPEDTTVYGVKNFEKIDDELLRYDFRLSGVSKAVGTADKENFLEYDRLGIRRKESAPDMGCYTYRAKE